MRHSKPLPVLLILAALGAGCGHLIYSSGPYRGRVIDAETRQPLAGAAVVAVWLWEGPGLGHPREGLHDALEVLTDSSGEFTIPRRTFLTFSGQIDEPQIVIYFPGYAPFPGYQVEPRGAVLESAFRDQTAVELRRLRTREERIRHAGLPTLAGGVPDKKIPNLIRLINQELAALGLEPTYREESR